MCTENSEMFLKAEGTGEEIFMESEDDDDNHKNKLDLCVLCCSKVFDLKPEKNEKVDILFKNLTAIFLLKKVLQVPDPQLKRNLQNCGNPENWIILCDQCTDLSRKAKELHSQIVKTARQLRLTEQLILDKVKSSVESPLLPPRLKREECQLPVSRSEQDDEVPRTRIWRITRDLIARYKYRNPSNLINPFFEGDKLAEKHLEKQQRSTIPLLKFEHEPVELDDYDTIWEGPDEEPDEPDERKMDTEWKPDPGPSLTRMSKGPARRTKTKKSSSAKPCEEDDHDTIWEEAEKEPDEPNEKLDKDKDWKPDPPASTTMSKESVQLSRRKKIKKLSTTKTELPPAPAKKPRLKRNQIAHVKVYGKVKCNFCDKLFASGGACYTHEREIHADIPGQFPCDLCTSVFNSERRLGLHKRQIHKLKLDGTPYVQMKPKKIYRRIPTICNICGKSAANIQQHHSLVHEKRVADFCHVCGAGFKTTNNWRHHLLSLHKDDPVTLKMKADGINLLRCDVKGCNANFLHKVSLERHVEKIHRNNLGDGGGGETFVCQICGKGFWIKDKLRRHELIHSKERDK